ncbi:MAG TPA: SCP2 sterol-binding domain-containing protein [Syntrophomonas sp.]|nr:SCP2 sterol-binding domain-containing protein [Syntrophomonas sp.]
MTTQEWFEEKKAKVAANPEAINGIEGSFQFDYTVDGQGIWHMVFPGDGTYIMEAGEYPDADVKVSTKWSVMEDIMSGKLNPNAALLTGKLKFTGDMNVLMSLGAIVEL